MRKLFYLLMILLMVFSITACTDTLEKEEYQSDSTIEEGDKEEVFGIKETAVFDNLKITALEVKESKGTDFFNPESGNVFVGINFEIENISDEEENISSLLMFDAYANDIKCDYSISAACAFDEGTLDGSVLPGKKLVGWYALEVPENWTDIELAVKSDWLSKNV